MTSTILSTERERIEFRLEHAQTASEHIDALIELERIYHLFTPSRQLALGQQALAFAQQTNHPELTSLAHLCSASALYRQSKTQEAAGHAGEALRISERASLNKLSADAHEMIARIYEDIGIYAEALSHLLQALRLYEEIQHYDGVATVYTGIGLNYGRQNNSFEAYRQFMQALNICEQHAATTNPLVLAQVLAYLGYATNNLGEYEQALGYAQRLLPFAELHHYDLGISNAWVITGNVNMMQKFYDAAAPAYQRGLDAALTSEMQTQIAYIYKLMGELDYRQGRHDSAITLLQQGIESAARSESVMRSLELYAFLPQVYLAAQRYEDAALAYETYFKVHQEVEADQQNIRTAMYQSIYNVERARSEVKTAEMKATMLLQDIERRDQTIAELDTFAQQVAHDLKNPLNIVQNYTLMLQGDLYDSVKPLHEEMMTIILAETKRMTEIVTTMLEVARLKREEVETQPVDMSDVVRSVIGRVKPLAAQYHAEISIETPLPMAFGIPGWLEEVWFNYLSNAMKYGGSPPIISVGAQCEGSSIRYWVHDNGDGISEIDIAKIFREFSRVGSHAVEGHGVGLSIVKTIVEKLDGKVGVESSGIPGAGSTFSFTLPAFPITATL